MYKRALKRCLFNTGMYILVLGFFFSAFSCLFMVVDRFGPEDWKPINWRKATIERENESITPLAVGEKTVPLKTEGRYWLRRRGLKSKDLPSVKDLSDLRMKAFGAPWCVTCKADERKVRKLAKRGLRVTYFNVDFPGNERIMRRYRVEQVPCYVLLDGGRVVAKTNRIKTIFRILKIKD